MSFLRLYTQLLLLVIIILTTTVITYSFVTTQHQRERYRDFIRKQALVIGSQLSNNCAHYLILGDYSGLQAVLLDSSKIEGIVSLQVCEMDGTLIGNVVGPQGNGQTIVHFALERLTFPLEPAPRIEERETSFVLWHPIRGGSVIGWLRMEYGLDTLAQISDEIWRTTIMMGTLWIMASVAALMVILRRPAAAIRRLSFFARNLDEQKGSEIVVDTFSTEIKQLGESLNAASQELRIRENQLLKEREQLILALVERNQAEEELQHLNLQLEERVKERTAQLEVANQELESFSYSVSHDLRGPLRHIDGYTAIVLQECGEQFNEEMRGYLEQVRKSTAKMSQLIEDLLTLSRINRSDIRNEVVDLSRLAGEIIVQLRQSDPNRDVKCIITEGITVTADHRLISIALENLFSNAWKYTSRREAAVIELGRMEKNGMNVYFLRDNGAGFDMAYANKLFLPFQRLHRPDEYEGTGIGLATVKRIIARHGGSIWAEGAIDQGATFFFTLPNGGASDLFVSR